MGFQAQLTTSDSWPWSTRTSPSANWGKLSFGSSTFIWFPAITPTTTKRECVSTHQFTHTRAHFLAIMGSRGEEACLQSRSRPASSSFPSSPSSQQTPSSPSSSSRSWARGQSAGKVAHQCQSHLHPSKKKHAKVRSFREVFSHPSATSTLAPDARRGVQTVNNINFRFISK